MSEREDLAAFLIGTYMVPQDGALEIADAVIAAGWDLGRTATYAAIDHLCAGAKARAEPERDESDGANIAIIESRERNVRRLLAERDAEDARANDARLREDRLAKTLAAKLDQVRAWAEVDRYKVSGDHSTWDSYHEGIDTAQGEVLAILDAAPESM
jgi:hypothetical protein